MNEADDFMEQTFLAGIRANPVDRLSRLVYADWLDEHNEDERAEFLRLQCSLMSSVERLTELRRLTPERWTRQVDLFSHTFSLYRLPPLGEGIDGARVHELLVRPLHVIPKGTGWLTVETDKAYLELPAEFDCVLVAMLVEVGQPVPIGAPIAVLLKL